MRVILHVKYSNNIVDIKIGCGKNRIATSDHKTSFKSIKLTNKFNFLASSIHVISYLSGFNDASSRSFDPVADGTGANNKQAPMSTRQIVLHRGSIVVIVVKSNYLVSAGKPTFCDSVSERTILSVSYIDGNNSCLVFQM